MKRLGVYACMVVSLVGMLGGFFAPEKATALTTGNTDYDYYLNPVNSYFDTANAAMDTILARDKSNKSLTPAQIKISEQANTDFKQYIAAMSAAYSTTFKAEFDKKTPAAEAQIKAIVANNQAMQLPANLRLISTYSASAPQRATLSQLSKSLSDAFTQATQIKNNTITVGSAEASVLIAATATIANAAKGNTNVVAQTSKKPSKCSLLAESPIIACLDEGITWLIKNTILQIGGFFVWLMANMFNYAVKIGILQFANWAPDQLYPIWLIIRQIISLFIVFIGLYLGLMYILGKDEKFQKYIPWVIMFALFVNFSYPLVRTAIDISNVVSLKIYASAVGPGALDESPTNTAGAQILDKLGLQGLLMSATATKDGEGGMLGAIDSVPGALLAVIYVFYAGYIFFMVTALIVMRTAALVFLIVASPLLLVDSVLPMLGDKAKDLRKIFFEQLAVGPIFMIMLALTLKFLDVFKSSGQLGSVSVGGSMGGGGMTTVVVFFNILMMLIMLWIMLKVTKDSAGSLGKYATDAFGKVGGFAAGVATSGALAGTGFLARKGIGSLAAKARDSKWVTNNQDSFIGRRAYNLSNSVANSTFDLRSTAIAQKYSNKLGMSSGMGAGTKMGYDEESKATLEKRTKEALARSARIKTHHERDVYKDKLDEKGNVVYEDVKDANGNVVKRVKAQELVHRKGDVDTEGWEAKNKLMASGGGTTFFRSREQTKKVREAMAKDEEEKAAKRIAENKANSAADIATYRGINGPEELPDGTVLTAKQSKARFLAGLENELDDLKKTDPTMQGNQAQSLIQSIQSIKKTEAAENAAFDKQVKYVLSNYMNKTSADKENYLSNQTQEVHEAVKALAAEQQAAKDAMRNGPLDLDLSTPVDIDVTRAAPPLDIDLTQPATPVDIDITQAAAPIDIDITQPYSPEKMSLASFAKQKAAERAAKQKAATQVANREMENNTARTTTQAPTTQVPQTIPRPTAANAPRFNTGAANDSNFNTGGAANDSQFKTTAANEEHTV